MYEMITYFIEQRNLVLANFWVIQLFFIHLFLSRTENLKFYNHQKLSFAIILLLSFGINFVSSFFKQCEFPIQDPDKNVKDYINQTKNMDPRIIEIIKQKTIKLNEDGERACSNKYNFFIFVNDYVGYLFAFASVGYLNALFLKSYSIVKLKSIINKNFISIDIVITLMGIVGFVLNIILLIISILISCRQDSYFINFCSADYDDEKRTDIYYFDNFLTYIKQIKLYLFAKDNENYSITPSIIILEIIFYFIIPIFEFFKMRFDLSIMKELGVFHLLIPEVIYQFLKDCYIIIYKFINNIAIDKTQIIQFIVTIISHLFAFIGFFIYLELIELRFCKLDTDINKNIALRANEDVEDEEDIEEMTEMKPFPIRDSFLDKNNEEKKNE